MAHSFRFSRALLAGLMLITLWPALRPAFGQELYQDQPGVEPRWISPENRTGAKGQGGQENRGGKGHPFDTIKAGESLVLGDVQGAGVIRRIWITINDRSPEMLRALRLEMFWDGAAHPAVSVPLGDFFGAGLGQLVTFENALFASPEGRSFVSYVPMPFRTSARIVLTNDSDIDLPHIYYDVDYTSVDRQPDDMLYFHAYWNRERPTKLGESFRVLPRVEGRGRYLGATVGVRTDSLYGDSWFGEGEVRIFLDGDAAHATLVGTGTEDYIGTGWGQGAFIGRYQGSPVADPKTRRWVFYRYHIPDPIFFDQACEVTLQQMGGAQKEQVIAMQQAGVRLQPVSIDAGDRQRFVKLLDLNPAQGLADPSLPDGWVNFYREDDVSAVAYFYLDRPESNLPPLAPVAERTANLK